MGLIFFLASSAHAGKAFNDLPEPVRAYLLREAIEAGVRNPQSIQANSNYDDRLPVEKSDLNIDGKRDYAVALCMFDEKVPEFRTNGFPCAFGTLILSNAYGGYEFIPLAGFVVRAQAGKRPRIVVRQRQFNGECKDYVCDFEYQLEAKRDGTGTKLSRVRTCLPDKC
jgi:hypothetical protein